MRESGRPDDGQENSAGLPAITPGTNELGLFRRYAHSGYVKALFKLIRELDGHRRARASSFSALPIDQFFSPGSRLRRIRRAAADQWHELTDTPSEARDESYYRSYVADLFEGVLGRPPDSGGLSYWVEQLAAGASEADVLHAFVRSEERQSNRKSIPMWVPPGHFYSPIVNPAEVFNRWAENWRNAREIVEGIDIDLSAMVAFWKTHLHIIQSTPFPSTKGTGRYHYENPAFCHADAIMLRTMLHVLRPKRVIEVGSGYSTACMLDTRDELGGDGFTLICIEPFADLLRSLMRPQDRDITHIIERAVQDVGPEILAELEPGDILFIDSTHVVKTASDVCHHLFTLLPHVPRGVHVHFHDIFRGFEYPEDWVIHKNFSWNESYALRAFLMYNSNFYVTFFNDIFGLKKRDLIEDTFPDFLKNTGGSLWMRRR